MREDIVPCSDKSVYIPSEDCVVLSDLHLGVVKPSSSYPVMEHEEIDSRINDIIEEHSPSTIVFNGDIFSNQRIDQASVEMMESYDEKVDDLIFTLGNHEEKNGGYPEKIRNKYEVCRNKKIGDFLIHHGHHTPPQKAKVHIIGHTHLRRNGKDVLMFGRSCFYNSDVVILPKFSDYVGGSDVSNVVTDGHCPLLADGRSLNAYQVVKEY